MTSNPAIFEKAIAGSPDYDDAIRTLARQGKTIEEIYEVLTVEDVQRAADLFRPLYDRLDRPDGFVSLEVNPHLAHDTQGTMAEARRLWQALDRPNVLIKVPATQEGLPAIRQLIGEGINVNVTLLFGLPRYREVAEAYIAGLEERAAQGQPLSRVASVASFFLSRIDVLLDPKLEKMAAAGGALAQTAEACIGQVAIASAKSGLHHLSGNLRQRRGSRHWPQRGPGPSASCGPAPAPRTRPTPMSNTWSPSSGPTPSTPCPRRPWTAYRDHGDPAARLTEEADRAAGNLARLAELGLDLDAGHPATGRRGGGEIQPALRLSHGHPESKRRELRGKTPPYGLREVTGGSIPMRKQRRMRRSADWGPPEAAMSAT